MPGDLFPETGRHTLAYKAAVWCGRLFVLWVASWCFLLPAFFAVTHNNKSKAAPFDREDLVVVLLWVAGAVLVLLTFALLAASGVEFGGSFNYPRFADRRVGRQFFRDLVWLPPR